MNPRPSEIRSSSYAPSGVDRAAFLAHLAHRVSDRRETRLSLVVAGTDESRPGRSRLDEVDHRVGIDRLPVGRALAADVLDAVGAAFHELEAMDPVPVADDTKARSEGLALAPPDPH